MRVEPDVWMGAVFGHDVFRVALEEFDASALQRHLAACEQRGFYYAKIPTTRVDQVQALVALGFHVVDVNVTFEREAGDLSSSSAALPIREARPEDREALLAIAEQCFVYSRFHLDPQVPKRIANAIKREWVDSYLTGRRGERLLTAEENGRPVGFLAVLSAKVHGRTMRVIDLVGVDRHHQGRGVGKSLIRAFVALGVEGNDLLRVGTQAANIPSMRLYERCGFHVADSAYVLHAHVNPQSSPLAA